MRRKVGQGGATQFLTFDSANRLRRVGTSVGNSDIAAFFYDADGTRLLETTGAVQRVFVSDSFEYEVTTGADPRGLVHVHALGRRIATKTVDNPTLRSAWAPLGWLPHVERPTLVRGATAALLTGLLLALLGLGLASAARARPLRTAVGLLALVCFVAPSEALAGGGGGGGTAKRRFYFGDHLGSSALITNKTGEVIERTTFEPFGLAVDHYPTPATESNERLFTGRRHQAASDLHDFRARWYDAHTGRFLSVDPIVQQPADPQTLNAYGYVRNNPVNHVDPTGLGFFKWLKRNAIKIVKAVATALLFTPLYWVGIGLFVAVSAYQFARQPNLATGAGLALTLAGAARAYQTSGTTQWSRTPSSPLTQSASQDRSRGGTDPGAISLVLAGGLASERGASQSAQPEDPCAGGQCGGHGVGLIDIPLYLIGYGVGKYVLGPIFGRIGGLFGSRAGEFAGQSVDDLARAAGAVDRSGLTAAGRALAKHGGWPGSAFPKPTGDPAQINRTAQGIVDDILRNPNSSGAVRQTGRFGQVTDVIGPDGRGLRFDSSGNFIGFLEP